MEHCKANKYLQHGSPRRRKEREKKAESLFKEIIADYSAIKKNKIMPFAATWMDLELLILSQVSQKEKDKYHVIPLTCGI